LDKYGEVCPANWTEGSKTMIPRDRWDTSLRLLPRPTRSAALRDSDFDDHDLRQIGGIAYNVGLIFI